jgi:ribonuclease P protein component
MLKRKYRLGGTIRFIKPHIFRTPEYVLKRADNNLFYHRFAIVVSKKVAKNAVTRNAIKRRLRRCLEQYQTAVPKGQDVLFIVTAGRPFLIPTFNCQDFSVRLQKHGLG